MGCWPPVQVPACIIADRRHEKLRFEIGTDAARALER
jgi:hypothetical protein